MQIAHSMDSYVVRLKPGKKISLLKYILPFTFKRKKSKEEITKEKGKQSKSTWFGILGLKQGKR